jgi:IS30 family transposase
MLLMGRFYRHLSLDERRKIHFWREEKLSLDEIAKRLGRHRATLYRELRRNTVQHEDKNVCGYFHGTAHHYYHRRRQQLQKVERNPEIVSYIRNKLRLFWSPKQIAGYMKHCDPDAPYICHETIYRYIYSEKGRELGLYNYLYRSRKHRARRYKRIPRSLKGLPKSMLIKYRPPHIDAREEFGHWEADLMISRREHGTKPTSRR